MKCRLLSLTGVVIIIIAIVPLAPGFVAGQGAASSANNETSGWKVPRTAWGDPDFQGIWRNEEINTPMERPARFGNREFLTDEEVAEREKQAAADYERRLREEDPTGPRSTADAKRAEGGFEAGIRGAEYNNFWMERPQKQRVWRRTSLVVDPPDGRLPPFTREAIARIEAREKARSGRGEADSWEDRNLNERCMRPQAATGLAGFKIVQTAGWVVFLPDGLQYARLVPLDGRPPVSLKIRGWFGQSRGRWEGDTLVVETTNFNDKQDGGPIMPSHFGQNGQLSGYLGSGDTLRRIERYRRVGPNTIEYANTTDDPNLYVQPYTVLRPMVRDDNYLMLQSGCHEGNYGMPNSLSAARADEQGARRAAAEEAELRRPQLQEMKRKTEEWMKKNTGTRR
jgi:hypothetical protein